MVLKWQRDILRFYSYNLTQIDKKGFYMFRKSMLFFIFIYIVVLYTGCGSSGSTSDDTSSSSENDVVRMLAVEPLENDRNVVIGSGYFMLKEDSPKYEALVPYFQGDINGSYLSTILENASIQFSVDVPDDTVTYGTVAGKTIEYVGFIFYPTKYNKDYKPLQITDGWNHPSTYTQMENSVDATPIFEDITKKYPLLVYSHGSNGEIMTAGLQMKTFASHEYVVLALFHGDGRFSDRSNEVAALRTLSIQKALDFIEKSKYASHIDFKKIGVFGNSFGGTTSFMLAGAKPIDAVKQDGSVLENVVADPRIVVAGAIEPYMGDESGIYPNINGKQVTFFGYDSKGAYNITTPYLAVSGTDDTTASERFTKEVLLKSPQNNHLVSMEGESHEMTPNGSVTADTWVYYFLNYHLKGDDTFLKMKEVTGQPVDTYIPLSN